MTPPLDGPDDWVTAGAPPSAPAAAPALAPTQVPSGADDWMSAPAAPRPPVAAAPAPVPRQPAPAEPASTPGLAAIGVEPAPAPPRSARPAHVNGRMSADSLIDIGAGHKLAPRASVAYRDMVAAAGADGVFFAPTSSYRTLEDQERVARKRGLYGRGGYAAQPGRSNHGFANALDLGPAPGRASGPNVAGSAEHKWLTQNGARFGYHTIKGEPWHWEFRDPAQTDMRLGAGRRGDVQGAEPMREMRVTGPAGSGTTEGMRLPRADFAPDRGIPPALGRDYASMGTIDRASNQLSSGVESLRQGLAATGLGSIYDEIGAIQKMRQGQPPPDANDPARPVPIGSLSPQQLDAYQARLEQAAGRKLAQIIVSRGRQAQLASNPAARQMVEALNKRDWAGGWRAFTSDPLGIMQQLTVESAPASAAMLVPGIGAGLIAGRAAGAVGAFLSSLGIEATTGTVERMAEALQQAGVDPSSEAAVRSFLQANPKIAVDAANTAGRVAMGPAIADAAGLGFARGLRPGAGIFTNTGRVGSNIAIEGATEGAGTAAGGYVGAGEFKPGDIAAEVLGGIGQALPTTAYSTMQEFRENRPVTAIPGLPPSPAGPGAAAVLPAAPPAAGPAASGVDRATAPTVPPATPSPPAAASPPVGTAPPPGASMPGGSPAAGASAPGAAPPPTPVNGLTQSLEQALSAPSPQQIAADIASMQPQLPPGWKIAAAPGGGFDITDPLGQPIISMDSVPRNPTDLLAEVQRAHQAGIQGGYYSGEVAAAAAQTNPAPTPAQAQAGNYAQGRTVLHGIPIRIETKKGATRSGVGKDGQPWSVQMPSHYGRIEKTTGADGDQMDVYLGPRAEDPNAPVFVIDQVDADTGEFDEHKVMLGFPSAREAFDAYDRAFNDGRGSQRQAGVTPMSVPELKAWLASDTTKPLKPERVQAGIDIRAAAKKSGEAKAAAEARGDELRQQAEERQREEKRRDEERQARRDAEARSRREAELRKLQEADERFRRQYERTREALNEALRRAREQANREREARANQDQTRADWERRRKAEAQRQREQPAGESAPAAQDAEGRWPINGEKLVVDRNGRPAFFATQIQAAKWIIRTGQPDSPDQFFEIVNHPGGKGFGVKEMGRNAGEPAATPGPAPEPAPEPTPAPAPAPEPPPLPAAATKPGPKRIVTDDRMEELKAKLRAKLNGQFNSGIDPEVLTLGGELAVAYIERGATRFGDWAGQVVADIGDAVRPYLRSWYEGARYYPGMDASGMTPVAEMDAAVAAFGASGEKEPGNADNDRGAGDSTGGTPPSPDAGPDAQPGDAPPDTGNLAPGQPEDVGQPDGGEGDGGVRVPGPAEDVGGTGAAPEGGDASDGRPRGGGKGASSTRPRGGRGRGGAGGGGGGTRPRGGAGAAAPGVAPDAKPEDADQASPAQPSAGNFHIDDPAAYLGGGPVARFNRNIAAIRMLEAVSETDRNATREEQAVLAGYTGWGSFGQALFQGTWERPRPQSAWEARSTELRDLLGQESWESAQRSITNAHYTDPPVVQAMWDMVARAGFAGGRVLEPSMGVGNFFGLMPRDMMARSRLTGIELDTTTGAIAKLLYPDADVRIMPYQQSRTPDNFYDLVIGNWPFEDTTIADRRYNQLRPFLHDYFFLKAMDQVRPGGLVVGITSSGTMDKESARIRAALAKQADLVASFRLPTGAFEGYAGTAVITDIIVLRKRAEPLTEVPSFGAGANWIFAAEYTTPAGPDVRLNRYYHANRDKVLGTVDYGTHTTIGRPGMVVHRPSDLEARLRAAITSIPEDAFKPDTRTDHISYVTNHTDDREGSLTEQDGKLFVVRGEQLAPAEQVIKYASANAKTTADREAQLRKLIAMRRDYAKLIEAERGGGDASADRKALRDRYEAFVAMHGVFADSYGLAYLRKIDDPFYPALAALEVNGKPATILFRTTMRGAPDIENPTIQDAYVLARNDAVQPTLAAIARYAGRSEGEVKAGLIEDGAVFETPMGDVIPSDIYLSGNVREKLRQAQAAVEDEGMTHLQRNVDALLEVVPKDIPYYQIETQLGATWVPPAVYDQYIAHMLGLSSTRGISAEFTNGRWKVRGLTQFNGRSEASSGFGTTHYRFSKLAQAAIRNQTVTIRVKTDDGELIVDQRATAETNERIANIRSSFREWLWSDIERRVDLETEYNEARNAFATPKYDGRFLRFQGMALSLGRGEFNLRQHQVNAIWRALVNRRSINAHEVGTGKTFTMGGIAVESRRYGIARKPMILAHNANSRAVATEIQSMYPAAKVLYIDNLSPDVIDIRLRQIANDDWDVVVVPHSLIDRFAMREETLMRMASEEIAALEEEAIEAANEAGATLTVEMMNDPEALRRLRAQTAKELVKQRNRIIETIRNQAQRSSREGAVAFEDLGIDMLMVDEVHEFKKPPIVTSMKMKGLQTQVSARSIALRFLTNYIQANNLGGNVHTFTGTPVTNTLTEIYHQMRYVMEAEMRSVGVAAWDGWFGSFASEVQDVELSAAGEYEAVTRLAGFINVPELRQMVGQYMDVVFADDMPEMKPRETASGKTMESPDLTEAERAELMNGRTENAIGRPYKRVINDTSDLTPEQQAIFAQLQRYAQSWRSMRGIDRRAAMMNGDPESPIITEQMANQASFDVRMVSPERLEPSPYAGQEGKTLDDPGSKASKVVANVMEIYRSHPLACQVIFTDVGYSTSTKRSAGRTLDGKKIERTVRTFSTVKDIVLRLQVEGIPADQIAVVTGSTTKDKRKEIADAMNEGRIRVVIGSTDTLGVGVNMQRNLRAMHHMDAPYMPGELEQRNGRGLRQGNQWNTVLEYRYMTDRLDGRRWQILAIKQRFISAFLKANAQTRVIDGDAASDEENDILSSFAEAAGDPRVLIREKLQKKRDLLQQSERLYAQAMADAKRTARQRKEAAYNLSKEIEAIEKAGTVEAVAKLIADQQGDGFTMTVGGTEYDNRADARDAIKAFAAEHLRVGSLMQPAGKFRDVKLVMFWPQLASEPRMQIEVAGEKFDAASIQGLEQRLRVYGGSVDALRERAAESEATANRMAEMATRPFQRAGELEDTLKRLTALNDDIAANPVPPPAWLRLGAPIDSAASHNGREFIVTGHRWNDEGWFVLAEDAKGATVIPYMEVTDSQGVPLYEERPFVTPNERGGAGQNAGPAVNTPPPPGPDAAPDQPPPLLIGDGEGGTGETGQVDTSVPAGWGEADAAIEARLNPKQRDELIEILRKILGPEAAVEFGPTGDARGIAAGALVRISVLAGESEAHWIGAHEAIHALRSMGRIADAEWTTLAAAVRSEGWIARFGIDRRYRTRTAEVQEEEAVAEAFAAWATGNMQVSGAVAQIFAAMKRLFHRIRVALGGRPGWEDVFSEIRAGQMSKRRIAPGPRLGRATIVETSRSIDRMVAEGRFNQDEAGQINLMAEPLDLISLMVDESPQGERASLRASLLSSATSTRDRMQDVLRRIFGRPDAPEGVEVVDKQRRAGLTPGLSRFRLPHRMFRRWPDLARLIDEGVRAEARMARWSKRLALALDEILGNLDRAGGDRANVMDALLGADADGLNTEDAATAAEHWTQAGLSEAEASAASRITRFLVKNARLVDQHRRDMLPQVREAKARTWRAMSALIEHATVRGERATELYRERANLTRRIREGRGDLDTQAARVRDINTALRELRLADPDMQATLAEMQDRYDELEARLVATSVRKRQGYFPHKFFGSWRLFEIGEADPETGERQRIEITSDQGFYDTQDEAIKAARVFKEQNPGAALLIEPRMVTFPGAGGGAVLSDAAYRRLRSGLEEKAGLAGEDLAEALAGVARRRGRRRVYSPGMFRSGAEGFARDMERVLRTHIAQTVRYVEMDRLKWQYVNTMERMGLSPGRQRSVEIEGRGELMRTMESWWNDISGGKQSIERQIDELLERLGLRGSVLAAMALGAGVGQAAAGPVVAPVLAGYFGYRMFRAMGGTVTAGQSSKAGDFPGRTFFGDITSDMAHLKLGLLINLSSAVVNLTQTAINTWPLLGSRWTGEGMQRATAALWSQARNRNHSGRASNDAILLQRAGVLTQQSAQADSPTLLVEARGISDRLKAISMLPFHTVESFNRAAAFLGAYAQAEDQGANPARAFDAGVALMNRSQFAPGQATRPEILRAVTGKPMTQFKNFLAQQMGFFFGLAEDRNAAQMGRFLLALFLVAGVLGLPGLWWLDWLLDKMSFGSPMLALKEIAIRAGAEGRATGTIADVLARGLPALLGVDISERVGMGAGFLPTDAQDWTGPLMGTLKQMGDLGKQDASLIDYLTALTGAARPLSVLEAAANGGAVTNPRKRDAVEYQATPGELLAQGLGFRPLRQALQTDNRQISAKAEKQRREQMNVYLSRAADAVRAGDQERVARIQADAAKAGIKLTGRRIMDEVRNAARPRSERDIRRTPRELRNNARERQDAIDNRLR